MPDQPPDTRATNAQVLSLPDPVLAVLSIPGIDLSRFGAVTEALGPLPIDGQVEFANRLIGARGQYLVHRMAVSDGASARGTPRKRLKEIGSAATRLLRLLHRDGADPQPWNLHPGITLALPRLYRVSSENRPNQVWDPPEGLSLLGAMLTDLAQVGADSESIFPSQFPNTRGGQRRKGPAASSDLVGELIEIYGDFRARFPGSGPELAFGPPLLRFVRAALTFVVSAPPEITDSDGRRYQLFEVRFLETDLPKTSRITDDAIRGMLDRRRSQTKSKNHLV